MVIKVGINGFGRIGRIVCRACLQNPSLQLSAINDPAISVEYICYLIKFDSTHGKLNGIITQNNVEIVIDGVHIKVFHERSPADIPWQAAGAQYVVEASGMFTNYEKASGHLASIGVKRVIVTAPSVDIPMVILGVNNNNISQDRRVISCASSTLYCLAPIIKVLEDSFGVEEGFITSIHAMTPSLKPLDGLCLRGKHWRDHRSILQNIIPTPTGACKALGRILPGSKDKLTGLAFRVPIVNVSVLDLTVRLQINTSIQEIVNSVQQAGKNSFRNIIKVSNDEAVSSDFIGETYSCIFDESSSIQLKPNFFKLICWYENEYSYACRIIDSITFSENQFFLVMPMSMKKMKPVTSSKSSQTDMPHRSHRCVCRTRVTCEMICLPQDTGDGKRTPISCLPKQSKTTIVENTPKDDLQAKKEALLKKWNNASEIAQSCEKPIKCPFFQSCVGFPLTSLVKVECDNKERLENVRREFTKMVSITEDILRKTQSNQGVRSKSKDKVNEASRASLLSNEKDEKSVTIMNSKNKSVEEIADIKFSEDTIQTQTDISYRDDMSFASNLTEKAESDDNNEVTENLIDISEAIKKLKTKDEDIDKKASVQLEKEGNKEAEEEALVKLNTDECKKSSETAFTANDIQIQSKEFNFVWNNKDINTNKQANVKHRPVNTELSSSRGDHLSNRKKRSIPETNTFKHRNDKIALKKLELLTKKSNMNLFDEALRKRNIVLVNESIAENESKLCDADDSPAESDDTVTVQKTLPVHYPLKKKSKCTTIDNTVTVANTHVTEDRQDIYDKLDSTSGSDSNNSFEIKERKSQVIQLTDLTNSLDDLTRLNTICRIIEISDELSDQLFSALDDPGPDIKKKRWSFKDLCARIKLDEFCNKVFGGITSSHD